MSVPTIHDFFPPDAEVRHTYGGIKQAMERSHRLGRLDAFDDVVYHARQILPLGDESADPVAYAITFEVAAKEFLAAEQRLLARYGARQEPIEDEVPTGDFVEVGEDG